MTKHMPTPKELAEAHLKCRSRYGECEGGHSLNCPAAHRTECAIAITIALKGQAASYKVLVKGLKIIAGGETTQFLGAPDVMKTSPAEFRSAMWSWSQKVARAALLQADET